MNKALVTFTPLEPYLFGGEQGFGNGEGQNYYAKGNPIPQQSTLCGTLRHLLLKNGYRRGPDSFNPERRTNDYGDLLSISPVFLTDKTGKHYLHSALDRHNENDSFTLETNALVLADTGDAKNASQWKAHPIWKGKDTKESLADYWICADGKEIHNFSSIFCETNRPGIPKREIIAQQGKSSLNGPGLHKKNLWRMQKGWGFSVIVKFSNYVDLNKLKCYTLPMGSEKVVFSIKIEKNDNDFNTIFPSEKFFYKENIPKPRMVLLSDTYVTDSARTLIETGVTNTVDFRHIKTVLKDEYAHSKFSYGPLSSWESEAANEQNHKQELSEGLYKSFKYTLLSRGSVLVFKNEEDLKKFAEQLKNTPWYTIGYNHFYIYQ